jgi:hypothetical protein
LTGSVVVAKEQRSKRPGGLELSVVPLFDLSRQSRHLALAAGRP